MTDLLLTHGYFMAEDAKELQIRKPYVPLGILYICSHLRQKGFRVEVFDTTFSTTADLFVHLQTESPSVLGILMADAMEPSQLCRLIFFGWCDERSSDWPMPNWATEASCQHII